MSCSPGWSHAHEALSDPLSRPARRRCARETSGVLQGYGEADYIYLASQETGVVSELNVREGDVVEAGARVFSLDPDRLALNEESARAQGAAASAAIRTAQAQATLAQSNYRARRRIVRAWLLPARAPRLRSRRDATPPTRNWLKRAARRALPAPPPAWRAHVSAMQPAKRQRQARSNKSSIAPARSSPPVSRSSPCSRRTT